MSIMFLIGRPAYRVIRQLDPLMPFRDATLPRCCRGPCAASMLADGAAARRVAQDRGRGFERPHICRVLTDTMDHGKAAREGEAGICAPHTTRHRGHHRYTLRACAGYALPRYT